MTTYGVSAVKLDAQGQVEIATIRQWDMARACWIGRHFNQTLSELLSLLKNGDKLRAIFRIDRAIVPGPDFQVQQAGGVQTIALPANSRGLTLQQLAKSAL